MSANRPAELTVTLWVIDNNSKDNTREIVRAYQERFPYHFHYLLERQQGYSAALNAGIRAGNGELIAMINDDEEVDAGWFQTIYDFFSTSSFDFAGGPYYPNWAVPKPDWITPENGGIVGWVYAGPNRQEYGPRFNGILMGGNSVIRRRVFERVGLYDTALGRTDKGLNSCEDEDMYGRLLAHGFRGMYLPELIIHHYIPAERMTKAYHRRWCFGRGTSLGVLSKTRKTEAAQIFGIPRWQIRKTLEGAVQMIKGWVGLEKPEVAFQGELRIWDFLGFLNGRFLRRTHRREPVGTSVSEMASDSAGSRHV
jgi:GT2 family glycosyltransferase